MYILYIPRSVEVDDIEVGYIVNVNVNYFND